MKLNLIPLALGMNPAHWARFTFISKQVWWDEKTSHTDRKFTFKPGSRPAPPDAAQVLAKIEKLAWR